ncbi:MAG: phage major capsid protein [Candidatus Coproplasma sp.]
MITVSTAEKVLKDYYLDVVISQLNGGISPFYNAIEKTSENVYGKEVDIAVVNGYANAVKACNENEALPSPKENKFFHITGPLKNLYGSIELTDKLIRSSADSSGAYVNLLNSEMESLIADAKSNLSRMLYGNGNGSLTTVKSKVSAYMLEVEDVKPFYAGRDVRITVGSTNIDVKILSINKAKNIINVSKSLDSYTFSGGEPVKLIECDGKELRGLSYIFDGTTVYGYLKESYDFFNPYVKSVSRSELSIDDILTAIDSVEEDAGGKINMILCSYKTRRMIAKLFENNRHIINSTDIQGGFTDLYINTIPVYADAFCPDGRIYILNTDDFVMCQLCDWSWLEDEGGKILKQVAGKAAYSATLVKYAELFCKRPCGQALIKLTD